MKYIILFLISMLGLSWFAIQVQAQTPPSFERNFGRFLTSEEPDEYGRVEYVFKICVDRNLTLGQNIQNLFYPNPIVPSVCSSGRGGLFRDIFRRLGLGLLFIFIVIAGIQVLLNANQDDNRQKALMSLVYIAYGGLLFLGSTWILGDVLGIGGLMGAESLVERLENRLFLQILTLLKASAFFVGIIMLVVYGYRIMVATDQEDKISSARQGIGNLIIALVAIKVIDYVYYIASIPTFASDAANFVLQIATVLGYIIGASIILSIFYLGFLLLTGGGREDSITKAKAIITSIALSALVIFLFLLIVYQVIQELL